MQELTLYLADEAATQAVAQAFAPALTVGRLIWLQGDLGAGKTSFIRALLRGLGVVGAIKSPSFVLVEPYQIQLPNQALPLPFYHFDFYRCTQPQEWRDAGFAEYFVAPACCAIEWPSQQTGLPPPDWQLSLMPQRAGRSLTFTAHTPAAAQWLSSASADLSTSAA